MTTGPDKVSIVIPAKNEAASLSLLLGEISELYPDAEVIVVNDGSTDSTSVTSRNLGALVIDHPYSKGNGAAIKSGARAASGDVIVFMDADGQHRPADIQYLLEKIRDGYDLAVGSRSRAAQASFARWCANRTYALVARWMVGRRVDDLTSGFRAVRSEYFKDILPLLPNGFSYPTTSTMAFFRAGHSVCFTPVDVQQRHAGRSSHIRILRDGARFFLIIFRVGTLYSPLKMFLPISLLFFLAGSGYMAFTLTTAGRFTNFGGVLLTTSIVIFLIGLVSEQITSSFYSLVLSDRKSAISRE